MQSIGETPEDKKEKKQQETTCVTPGKPQQR
jgi:hypothetical protein